MEQEQYLQRYDGLSWRKLIYDDRWLIVIIEALWYCESRHKNYIRFNRLKVRCNDAIWTLSKLLGKHEMSIPDGTFASIIDSDRCKEFLTVEHVKVKTKKGTWVTETRTYPHITEIQQEIKCKKIESLANGKESLAQIHRKRGDTINRKIAISDSVPISDFLTRQTAKARAPPSESVKVSDTVSAVVTYANQRKQKKRKKF